MKLEIKCFRFDFILSVRISSTVFCNCLQQEMKSLALCFDFLSTVFVKVKH